MRIGKRERRNEKGETGNVPLSGRGVLEALEPTFLVSRFSFLVPVCYGRITTPSASSVNTPAPTLSSGFPGSVW
jgi:hypothetical protein